MFRGRYEHNLDEKGRLAIPSKFRERLLRESKSHGNQVVVTNFDQCLCLYPMAEWEKLEEKFANLPQFDANVMAFQRYFISGAAECQVDKGGRILIPQNLRQFAKIKQECIIAGQLTKIEIWAKESWETAFNVFSDQFNNISQSVSQMGINI